MKKKILLIVSVLFLALNVLAQGGNTGMGGTDEDIQSIAGRITNLEKKNDILNLYFNYSASCQIEHSSLTDEWTSKFVNKQLRIEIKGNLTDRIYYRFRHRLNRPTEAKSKDNFAKATDVMMVGYDINKKITVQGGKMCKIWGGYEFDENPIYIYQYSDFESHMDNFMAGVILKYKPIPSQEIAVEVSNVSNGSFEDEYGDGPITRARVSDKAQEIEKGNIPLVYIINWNGSLWDGLVTTRWAWGLQTQAKNKYSRMLTLGQQLHLSKLQWYVDYMGAFDDLDRLGIANEDLSSRFTQEADNGAPLFLSKVHYNSFITKMNWQFAPAWNLMLKGMYETVSVTRDEQYKNYRKSFGYIGSVEYYPAKQQDFRVFLAYVGRKFNYSKKCGLEDYNTDRIELGFMYRIKAY